MYANDTILELKEPKSTDKETFPYDRVRVVGVSPVNAGVRPSHYTGTDAQGVIITPLTSFGANLDEPFGKLAALYKIVEEPKVEIDAPKIRIVDSRSRDAGPTPEERFATEAPGEASKDGERVRTPISPLSDPRAGEADGPLGRAPTPQEEARSAEEAGRDSGTRTVTEVGRVE